MITQLQKERNNLVLALNAAFSDNNKHKDNQSRRDIFELHNQCVKLDLHLKILREYNYDLNEEINRWKKQENELQNNFKNPDLKNDEQSRIYKCANENINNVCDHKINADIFYQRCFFF